MWFKYLVYFLITFQILNCWEYGSKEEPLILIDLFLENLKQDPFLLNNEELSNETKQFIDSKTEKMSFLIFRNLNNHFINKRDIQNEQIKSQFSINISLVHQVPTSYSDDIRIFQQNLELFAVSLQNHTELVIFKYLNKTFTEVYKYNIQYSSNVGVSVTDDLILIVVAKEETVTVFNFRSEKNDLGIIQRLKITNAKYIVLWMQDGIPYLSVLCYINDTSVIMIYKWLGGHFDLVQELELFNIRKIIQFAIHETSFLVAIKHKATDDEPRSFSEVYKYNIDEQKYILFQKLLAGCSTDIKHFVSELHGEKNYFLITTSNTCEDHSLSKTNKSIIYIYEDHYFIPFQSFETDAVEWQPIQDNKEHAALVSFSSNGLEGFQYDGWRFFEDKIEAENEIIEQFLIATAIHVFEYGDNQYIVTAGAGDINIYRISFTRSDLMKQLYADMLSWCTKTLKEIEVQDKNELVGDSLRGDLNEILSPEEEEKHQLFAFLNEVENVLPSLKNIMQDAHQSDNYLIFQEDLDIENIIFNDFTEVNLLETKHFNNFEIYRILNNALNIVDGFDLDENTYLDFDIINVENSINPEKINDISLENYVNVSKDNNLNILVVNGSITFNEGVDLTDTINNITVNNEVLLLNGHDQMFLTDLYLNEIKVLNLSTKYINNLDVDNFHKKYSYITHLDTLNTEQLEIGGYLNGISLEILNNITLKNTGQFVLQQDLFVESLSVDYLNIDGDISGRYLNDFVIINGGEQTVDQDVYFQEGLIANQLEVLNSLNNITVQKTGALDILLKNTSLLQFINSKKVFDALTLINPINVRNGIKSKRFQQMNIVQLYDSPLQINNSVTIEGRSKVNKFLNISDFETKNGRSMKSALENGIKITDREIPSHLTFSYPLDLEDIVADKVNGHDPYNWLLKESDSSQIVVGKKIFLHDLDLIGQANAFKINEVNVQELQKDILRVVGDQVVTGNIEVSQLVADDGIRSNYSYFGQTPWNTTSLFNKSLNTAESQIIQGSQKYNFTKAKTIEVKGLINSVNINNIFKDLAKVGSAFKVFGTKTFKDLYIDELHIMDNESELSTLIKSVNENLIVLNENFDLYYSVSPKNINFNKEVNNLTNADFVNLINAGKSQNIIAPVYGEYDEIKVLGNVYIEDNRLSGIDIDAIANDSVKIDEDHVFEKLDIVETIILKDSLVLDGNIDHLDLYNIVFQNSTEPLQILDKTFYANISIEGTLKIGDTLNTIDVESICKLSENHQPKHLKIIGKAIFGKGPRVGNINGLNVNDLKNNLWFVDKSANITGTVHVENATFRNDVNVKGYIDEINIKLIYQNYLSKTKFQKISSNLSFENVTFVNISAPELLTSGLVNGILLENLLKIILLQDTKQIFEDPPYFEVLTVEDLRNDVVYTVNDLNLNEDVMLYDKNNIVTGQKNVTNMTIKNLKVKEMSYVQNVDILDWMSHAILKNGTFRIPAKKTINRAVFQSSLSLKGTLNDQEFNSKTVMLINTPQNVIGKKIFMSGPKGITRFRNLKVKGLVNGVDVRKLISNQANRKKDSIINSTMLFNNSINVKNINMELIYDKVNVTELLMNISEVGTLERFRDSFETLTVMGHEVEASLKGQGSFFKYFKEILHLEQIYELFGIRCTDGVFRILTFSFLNNTNLISTYEWDINRDEYVKKGQIVESFSIPRFIEQVSLNGKDYVYIEHDDSNLDPLLEFSSPTTYETICNFSRYGTQQLISFSLPGLGQSCLGFINLNFRQMDILCDDSGHHTYYILQELHYNGIYKAMTVTFGSSLYLFLAIHYSQSNDPAIVVLEFVNSGEGRHFIERQTIFEGAEANGLSAAVIDNVPYVAFSFTSQEATIDIGRISIKKWDASVNQFLHWQYIPLTSPLDVHFVASSSFELLLIASSKSTSSPCPTFKYDGVAGFQMILRGTTLPINSNLRIFANGNIVAVLQRDSKTAVLLGAVVKGNINFH